MYALEAKIVQVLRERVGGRLEVVQFRATTDLDEKLDDGFHDVEAFSVHPDQGGDVPHVEMPILVDQLVEDADDWSILIGPNDKRESRHGRQQQQENRTTTIRDCT